MSTYSIDAKSGLIVPAVGVLSASSIDTEESPPEDVLEEVARRRRRVVARYPGHVTTDLPPEY